MYFDKFVQSPLLYMLLTLAMDKHLGKNPVNMLKMQSWVKTCMKLDEIFLDTDMDKPS